MDQKKLKIIEYVIVAILSLLLGIILTTIPGKEAHTDVLWYMNMGLNNIADPHWMNRYTHVYLQKIFLEISSDPFQGLVNYWAFLLSGISFLIYWNTRFLSKANNFIHASLAVIIFLSLPIHSRHAGIALADYTSTFIVLLIFLVYQISAKHDHAKPKLIVIIGIALFLAYRTKETAWVAGIVVLGLFFDKQDRLIPPLIKKNLLYLVYGGLIGILSFSLLNGLLLNDFLFGFRPENFSSYYDYWIGDPEYYQYFDNWFTDGIWAVSAVPFSLYLINGINKKNFSIKHFILWIFPLLTVITLTTGMIKNNYLVYPRFLMPSFAVICLFVPLFIQFEFPKKKDELIKFVGVLLLGLILLFLIRSVSLNFSKSTGMDNSILISGFLIPVYFSLLLIAIAFFKNYTPLTAAIPILLLLAIFQPDLFDNIRKAQYHPGRIIQTRFYPVIAFQDQIKIEEDMLIFTSTNFHQETQYLDKDKDTIRTIFDLQFQVSTKRENYLIADPADTLAQNTQFTYIFITYREWINLPQNTQTSLLTSCTPYHEPDNNLTFLDCYP